MAELKHILKEVEFRQNFVGEGFLKPPEGNYSRVNIFGEISSLSEFNEDNLYLFYEFSLPLGCKIDDENEYYLIYKTENIEEENINKIKSISQITESYVESFPCDGDEADKENYHDNIKNAKNKNYTTNIGSKFVDRSINKHNLSLPFELELLYHNSIVDHSSPKLLIQINSTDSYNRHRIEGYCFINVPMQTGFYQFEVPCYKPKEDNYMKVFSFFLGGSRKIPDLREIAKTSSKDENNVDTVLNRYGISTEYVGKVSINLNIVIQTKQHLNKSRVKAKEKQGREAFGIMSQIESHISGKEVGEDIDLNNTLMKTKAHGIINRFSK